MKFNIDKVAAEIEERLETCSFDSISPESSASASPIVSPMRETPRKLIDLLVQIQSLRAQLRNGRAREPATDFGLNMIRRVYEN